MLDLVWRHAHFRAGRLLRPRLGDITRVPSEVLAVKAALDCASPVCKVKHTTARQMPRDCCPHADDSSVPYDRPRCNRDIRRHENIRADSDRLRRLRRRLPVDTVRNKRRSNSSDRCEVSDFHAPARVYVMPRGQRRLPTHPKHPVRRVTDERRRRRDPVPLPEHTTVTQRDLTKIPQDVERTDSGFRS